MISTGCLSHFVQSCWVCVPHTTLPYNATGSIIDLNILSQVLLGSSGFIDLLMAQRVCFALSISLFTAKLKLPVFEMLSLCSIQFNKLNLLVCILHNPFIYLSIHSSDMQFQWLFPHYMFYWVWNTLLLCVSYFTMWHQMFARENRFPPLYYNLLHPITGLGLLTPSCYLTGVHCTWRCLYNVVAGRCVCVCVVLRRSPVLS